jgi:hypothetical protein
VLDSIFSERPCGSTMIECHFMFHLEELSSAQSSRAYTVNQTLAPVTNGCSSLSCSGVLSAPIPVRTRYGRHLYNPISSAILTACPPARHPLVSAHDASTTTISSIFVWTYFELGSFPLWQWVKRGYASRSFPRVPSISSGAHSRDLSSELLTGGRTSCITDLGSD